MTPPPEIARGFPEDQRATVAALYWQGFGAKLGKLLGPAPRGAAFFARILDPAFCLTARDAAGRVIGLAGFRTSEGALAKGTWSDLAAVYGWPGALWRAPCLSLLERTLAPGTLLMDGIVVAAEARGTGLGTRLLEAICAEARERHLLRVRLDVIDTNPRARALYARRGFVARDTRHLGPLRWIFGFRSATRMERSL